MTETPRATESGPATETQSETQTAMETQLVTETQPETQPSTETQPTTETQPGTQLLGPEEEPRSATFLVDDVDYDCDTTRAQASSKDEPAVAPPSANPRDEYECLREALKTSMLQTKELEKTLAEALEREELLRKEVQSLLLTRATLKDPQLCRFYTGLRSVQVFDTILNFVKPEDIADMRYPSGHTAHDYQRREPGPQPSLSPEQQLLITLVKLRQDTPTQELAIRFRVSQSTISRCFRAMVNMLYVKFSEIPIWPSRAQVKDSMPSVFKSLYPSTRVVLDCTEVSIDKPADPLKQASTFSSYKNRNTLKWLVGITPSGAVSFVSDAFGGRTSDKEVTRLSDFYKKLDPGDAVMADRGFDLEDDLSKVGCQLNIPPFLGRRLQLSPEEVTETRRIASVRIHVERAMERIKNFRILHHLPASILPLANRIFLYVLF